MRARSLVTLAGAIAITIAALFFGALHAPAAHADPVPLQGSCGDYQCQPPEDCRSCPQDCGNCCGNRRCEPPEDCNSCPADCC